eukprot:RCo045267
MTITPAERAKSSNPSSSTGRDMDTIRGAFKTGDADTMRAAHEATPLLAAEKHGGAATEYVKGFVFGGLDGILTTFAVVTAAAGAAGRVNPAAVLVFGFANLLADGIAMGFGEYTSSKAELDFAMEERRREEWELETNPEGEKQEMVDLYINKGVSEQDASAMMDVMMKYPKVFVDLMMIDELGIQPDAGEDEWAPLKQGVIMFVSFITFGSVPLLAYLADLAPSAALLLSCGLTGACLFVLGYLKGKLIQVPRLRSATSILLSGFAAASLSYLISFLVAHAISTEGSSSSTSSPHD